jgi:diketogulonate reductase-like aldo/keto reductase
MTRDDVFLATELPLGLVAKEAPQWSRAMRSLGTDQVDLWLLRWAPGSDDPSAALSAEFINRASAGTSPSSSAGPCSALAALACRTAGPRSGS